MVGGGWTSRGNLSAKHTPFAVFLVIDFPTRNRNWTMGWLLMPTTSSKRGAKWILKKNKDHSSPNWNVASWFSRNYPTPKLHQIYLRIFWSRMIKKIMGISSCSHEEISETVLWDLAQVQTNTLSACFSRWSFNPNARLKNMRWKPVKNLPHWWIPPSKLNNEFTPENWSRIVFQLSFFLGFSLTRCANFPKPRRRQQRGPNSR